MPEGRARAWADDGRQEADYDRDPGHLARQRISREQFAIKTKLGKSTVDKLLTGLLSDRTLVIVESHRAEAACRPGAAQSTAAAGCRC